MIAKFQAQCHGFSRSGVPGIRHIPANRKIPDMEELLPCTVGTLLAHGWLPSGRDAASEGKMLRAPS